MRWKAYDPDAFGGDGRGVIVAGDDAYRAKTVRWYIVREPLDELGKIDMGPVLEQLRRDQQNGPAAAVIWVGKSRGLPGGLSRNAFYSDLAAFRAARKALGEPPAENHVSRAGLAVHQAEWKKILQEFIRPGLAVDQG